MKKQFLSFKKTILSLSLFVFIPCFSQQVIGSFPSMDGGFESQANGNLAVNGLTSGNQSSNWTVAGGTSGSTYQVTNSSSSARTNNMFLTLGNTTSATRRWQSPTNPNGTTASGIQNGTSYVVQYFYRTGSTNITNLQAYLALDGGAGNIVGVAAPLTATNGLWTKATVIITTSNSSASPRYGVGGFRVSNYLTSINVDIDDFVVYPGSTVDITAPDAPTTFSATPASNQNTISWSAPGNGVDGGGYLVVRYTSDPTGQPEPNANGIYAVGNSIGLGTVKYIGTNTSFIDTGLSLSTSYYYRIYTVDKAFNYSTALTGNVTTLGPSYATEPTAQVSGLNFTNVTSSGMTINWTNDITNGGTNHLVVIGTSLSGDPVDGLTYISSTDYTSISSSSVAGGKVVYNGTENTVNVTGLTYNTNYYVRIYDFNGSSGTENYLIVNPSSGSQITDKRTLTSVNSGVWSTDSTWSPAAVPTLNDNVVINSGHTVTFTGINANSCYNLSIDSGGQLYNTTNSPTYTIGYIGIYGTSVVVNGALGDALTEYLTGIQFNQNCTLSGAGTVRVNRIRPFSTALTNATFIFDTDATLTNSSGVAMMCENTSSNPVGYKINLGKTVTSLGSFTGGSSATTNSTQGFTLTVDGTLNLNSKMYLNAASGKQAILTVNGTLNVKTLNGSNFATGGGSIPIITTNGSGLINVTGTSASADFSNTSTTATITGTGAFTLASGATILVGSSDGLNATSGPIRCATRNFSTEANYTFNGAIAQITGSDTPSSVNRLTINNSSGVTLSSPVAITDRLILTSGQLNTIDELTLKSTALKTALVAEVLNPSATSVNGKVNVERYIPAKRGWRLLTAPLKGLTNTLLSNNWQGVNGEGLLLFSPLTYQSQNMIGYVTGGSSPNIWKYNNSWQSIPDLTAENLFNSSENKPYLVFVTGSYGSSTIANTSLPEATTLRPKGNLIIGDVSYNLNANQFNLIANPYASPLNTASLKISNPDFTFWLLDPTLGNYGGYYTFNGTDWTPITPNETAGQPDNNNIQSGQAFFVKSSTATTFTISESHKVLGSSNTWFERNTTNTAVDKIRALLYKQIDSQWQLADGILAVNSVTGNNDVDSIDTNKMTNFNENIAFRNGTSNLAIEYRDLPALGTIQPIRLTGTSVQPYQLRLKTENYSNSNLQPYVEDNITGALTAIPTDGSEVVINFTGLVSTASNPDTRFRVVYSTNLSLNDSNTLTIDVFPNPVEKDYFTVILPDNAVSASYKLNNIVGQQVQEGILDSIQSSVPVSSLQVGVYLLQIEQSGKTFTTKLIVN
jgi:hypothetical protein